MGALQGHMNHLYDNGDLTFGDIKNILSKASAGELEGTEKVDGQNIMISYSVSSEFLFHVHIYFFRATCRIFL